MKTQSLSHQSKFACSYHRPAIRLATLALAVLGVTAQAQPPEIIRQYELPPFSYLDLGYTQEQVDHAAEQASQAAE